MKRARIVSFYSIVIILSLVLSACGIALVQPNTPTSTPLPITAPSQVPTATEIAAIPELTPTSLPLLVWIDPRLPGEILDTIGDALSLVRVTSKEKALLSLTIETEKPIISWAYALAAPFATITDDVSVESLIAFWQTNADFPARVLVMPPAIFDSL